MAAIEDPYPLPKLSPESGSSWISWNQHEYVYIAGPMAGMPDHGFPAFHKAEAALWQMGVIPLSPARGAPPMDVIDVVVEMHGGDFRQSSLYAAMMRRDFAYVIQAKALFMLPNWENSNGARAEAYMGQIIGNPLFDGAWLLDQHT